MGRSTLLKVGLCCAGWLLTSLAAGAPSVRLVIVRSPATEGCVDEPALKGAVASRLGYNPFAAEPRGTLLLRLSRGGERLLGSVELIDEQGESRGGRQLSTALGACDEMTRALALSISLAIDPEHAARETALPSTGEFEASAPPLPPEPAPSPAPVQPSPDRSSPSVAPPVEPAVAPLDRERARFSLSLLGLVASGIAPVPAFGAAIDLQVTRGHWAAGLGGLVASAPESGVAGGARLRASVVTALFDGCFEHGVVELCAVALLGTTWARASGVDRPRTDGGLFAAAGARAGLVAPLSRSFSLLAQGQALALAAPMVARVDGAKIWGAPRLSAGLALGLRAQFW